MDDGSKLSPFLEGLYYKYQYGIPLKNLFKETFILMQDDYKTEKKYFKILFQNSSTQKERETVLRQHLEELNRIVSHHTSTFIEEVMKNYLPALKE